MFDLTNRLRNCGSIDCPTPQMFEIVAVGAIAMTFELRMPTVAHPLAQRRPSPASCDVSTSSASPSRASCSSASESIGRIPRLHSEPSKLA